MQTITPRELSERQRKQNTELIDVRTPAEFREVHASIARNIPLDSLDPERIMTARNGSADQPLYLICRSGNRSANAYKKFVDAGYTNVVNVEGGTREWEAAGLPLVRGKKTISLERQVRITAGALVLIGGLLGIFVHPYYAGISAFVGAGLIFAGITDTCGMGLMLAKMPWNQVKDTVSCCSAKS